MAYTGKRPAALPATARSGGTDPDCSTGGDERGFGFNECNNNADDDRDGLTDRADPDCANAFDDSEGVVTVPGCLNGLDDDGDGAVDAADRECRSAVDNNERA